MSKLFSAFTQPLVWVAVLFLLAMWWLPRRPVWAQRVLIASLALTAIVGWLPLPDALLRYLEDRYPVSTAVAAGQLQRYTGVVVLGSAVERDPVALMRQYPHLKMLFTGGDGRLWPQGPSEADEAEAFFTHMGIAPERIQYERASRTTYENAVLGAAVPGVDQTQPWLLVTSAWHMPRSMAIFRAAGWNVTPYPVDYRTGRNTPWTDYSLARGALRWQIFLHEIVGIAVYAMMGRTKIL